MSSAQCGYVDPSFADKGAADETDEVQLQVVCLTGEGVTLSKKLSCKLGARLVVHHVNGKLMLDKLETKGSLEKPLAAHRCPALTYQLMCTQHGVMPVMSSQTVTESLPQKVLHILKEQHTENIYTVSPAALQA